MRSDRPWNPIIAAIAIIQGSMDRRRPEFNDFSRYQRDEVSVPTA